jgi:ABC-type polysaccharide/polyol phosphate export permease
MRESADAAIGLMKRDWLTFASYRTQLASMIFGMFTSLTLYYFLSRLVHVSTFKSSDDYFAFVVVGMVIVQVLQSTIGIAATLRGELVAGTFERLVLSPFGAVAAMVAMMVFPFVMALLSSVIMLVLATTVFGVHLRADTAVLALPIALLGTGVFTAFGMLLAAVTIVFKRAVGGLGLVLTLVSLTSGLYFPIALLPAWLQWVSTAQPFTPAVDLLRNVLVGTPLQGGATSDLAKMIGFLVVTIPLGLVALNVGLRTAQRRGTIMEY